MNLESQVTSLELSKRLKELGVKQESYFVYAGNHGLVPEFRYGGYRETRPDIFEILEPHIISAFTVAELGAMLPDNLCLDSEHPYCFIAKGTQEANKWTIGYSTMQRAVTPFYTDENEADARARMLIYLIENKLIEVAK